MILGLLLHLLSSPLVSTSWGDPNASEVAQVIARARAILPHFSSIQESPGIVQWAAIQDFFESHPEALADPEVSVLAWRLALSPAVTVASNEWQRHWGMYLVSSRVLLWSYHSPHQSLDSIARAFVQTAHSLQTRHLLDQIFSNDSLSIHPGFFRSWIQNLIREASTRAPRNRESGSILRLASRIPVAYFVRSDLLNERRSLLHEIDRLYQGILLNPTAFASLFDRDSGQPAPGIPELHRLLMSRSGPLRLVFQNRFQDWLSPMTTRANLTLALGIGSPPLSMHNLRMALRIMQLHTPTLPDAESMMDLVLMQRALPNVETLEDARLVLEYSENLLRYQRRPIGFWFRHFSGWSNATGLLIQNGFSAEVKGQFDRHFSSISTEQLLTIAKRNGIDGLRQNWRRTPQNTRQITGMLQLLVLGLQRVPTGFVTNGVNSSTAGVYRSAPPRPDLRVPRDLVHPLLEILVPLYSWVQTDGPSFSAEEAGVLALSRQVLTSIPVAAFDQILSGDFVPARLRLLSSWNNNLELNGFLAPLFTAWGLDSRQVCTEAQLAKAAAESTSKDSNGFVS